MLIAFEQLNLNEYIKNVVLIPESGRIYRLSDARQSATMSSAAIFVCCLLLRTRLIILIITFFFLSLLFSLDVGDYFWRNVLHFYGPFLGHLGLLSIAVEVDFRYEIDAGDGKDGSRLRQKTRSKRRWQIHEVIVIQSLLYEEDGETNRSLYRVFFSMNGV